MLYVVRIQLSLNCLTMRRDHLIIKEGGCGILASYGHRSVQIDSKKRATSLQLPGESLTTHCDPEYKSIYMFDADIFRCSSKLVK